MGTSTQRQEAVLSRASTGPNAGSTNQSRCCCTTSSGSSNAPTSARQYGGMMRKYSAREKYAQPLPPGPRRAHVGPVFQDNARYEVAVEHEK